VGLLAALPTALPALPRRAATAATLLLFFCTCSVVIGEFVVKWSNDSVHGQTTAFMVKRQRSYIYCAIKTATRTLHRLVARVCWLLERELLPPAPFAGVLSATEVVVGFVPASMPRTFGVG
jgi:hypothetical protein